MIFRNVIGGSIIRGLLLVALLTFVLNVLALVQPVYMLQVYDRVLASASLPTLAYLTLIAVVILMVLGAIEAIRQVVVQRVGTRLEIGTGEKLLVAALGAGGHALDATSLIRDLAQVRSFLASPVFSALLDVPFAPLFLFIVFMIHPMLGGLVLSGIAVLLVLTIMNQWAVSAPQRKSSDAAANAGNLVVAFARNGEALRAMGMVGTAIGAWGAATVDALNAQDRATAANAVFSGMSRSVRLIVQLGILGLGAYLTLKQEITAGMIFATSLVAGRALAPVDNLIAGWKGLLQSLSCLRRIDRILGHKAATKPERTRLPAPKGQLLFEKVIYAPDGAAEPTIRGIVAHDRGRRGGLPGRAVGRGEIDLRQTRRRRIAAVARHDPPRRVRSGELGYRTSAAVSSATCRRTSSCCLIRLPAISRVSTRPRRPRRSLPQQISQA